MKAFYLLLFLSLALVNQGWTQRSKFKVYFNTVQFYEPSIGNYLELHFQFDAKHTKFIAKDKGLQATTYLKIEIKDSINKIFFTDEYLLNSPIFNDSTVEDFFELRRIPLAKGLYQINLTLSDWNVKNSDIRGSQLLEVTDMAQTPTISQVEAIDYAIADTSTGVFQKNGFLIIPKLNAYYGTMLNTLPVYFELYQANNSPSRYFIEEAIIDTENQRELFSYHKSTELTERDQVVPMIKRIDITNLASGAYAYAVSLVNDNDSVVYSSEYFFERGNIILDDTINYANTILDPNFQQSIQEDSLQFYLGSLLPIVKSSENKNIRTLLKTKDFGAIRKYFQAFWNSTSPGDATYAWLKYKQQVQYVQGLYKTNFQSGYETDRGRVYLQYGAPSTVNTREDSPSEYPYEIWFYNKIGKFSNRRFIFYNPDLTNNAYRLLHSDLVGEVKNPGWSQILSKRNTINGTVDDPNLFNERHWGQNSNDLFRQY